MSKHRDESSYENMEMNDRLVMNLRDLGHTLRFLYEGKGSQKRILLLLNKKGSMTQRELTERIGIQPGSASEVIAKLESAGLIVRKVHPDDRRTADIELSEAGIRLANEALEERNKRHTDMFSTLSEAEKETLVLLCEKLNKDWHTRYHEKAKHKKTHKRLSRG